MKKITLLSVVLMALLSSLTTQARRDESPFERRQRERMEERRKQKELEKRANQINWGANYQDLLNENSRFFKRLFDRYENGNIVGLELVIASSSWSNIESGFGHTMLRFVDNVGTEADDVVLSFVANVDTLKLNYFKGIFGGYPVFPQVKSLRMFMDEYNNKQRRDLDRYIIISNEEIRSNIIRELKTQWEQVTKHRIETQKSVLQNTLDELNKFSTEKYGQGNYGILPLRSGTGSVFALTPVPNNLTSTFKTTVEEVFPVKYELPESSELGDYTFFSNNCAGALVNFLKQVGYPYHKKMGFKGRIPLALPDYLQRALINPYPIIKIHSLRELKDKVANILELKDETYLQYDIDTAQVKKLQKKLSLNEFRKLNEIATLDLEAFKYYASQIQETKAISFDELHGITKAPDALYEICNNSKCEQDVIKGLEEFYGTGSFSKIKEINKEKSLKSITRWKRDHDTKRRERVITRPYKGLLVNKKILDHQKRFYLLDSRW
ncbi:DUF4105 domain-containing protein [Oceanospirillum sp. RT-1-3]|uniref:lipoprotein N-acyltransferase Lnb domain-containing protein n=1 Tax=unclassified Halobacteriovorax TaxID=2639665 RepID=UPI00399B4E8D